MDRPVDDQILVQAMRKRILDEINRREEAKQAAIVNNINNGGSGGNIPMHGVADQMTGVPDGEDPYDYFVDITRRDLEDVNPATGKPAGWKKSVHRHRKKKVTENRNSQKGQNDDE